jgi:hypothetical protein
VAKEDITQKYWVEYLRYWKKEVRDLSNPPTEDAFWSWYAFRKLDLEHNPETDPDLKSKDDE